MEGDILQKMINSNSKNKKSNDAEFLHTFPNETSFKTKVGGPIVGETTVSFKLNLAKKSPKTNLPSRSKTVFLDEESFGTEKEEEWSLKVTNFEI